MIISKTPLRLSLAGGGTDLPEYYSKFGSYIITSAINKNIYIFLKEWFNPAIRLSYSKTEIVNKIDEIKHPMIREAFRHFTLKSHIEMAILADLPAGTRMGTSGSFAVGLLNTISHFKIRLFNATANCFLSQVISTSFFGRISLILLGIVSESNDSEITSDILVSIY